MNKSKCSKCGHEAEDNKSKFGLPLCDVCYTFSPNSPEDLDNYVEEKVNSEALQTFRKHKKIGEVNKKGMIAKAAQGKPMARPAFGYKFNDGKLVPTQNYRQVEEIFHEFLTSNVSLRKLSKKYGFSVNGLKKILTNFTYIGKIKFNNQIYEGNHQPIISATLFNQVQNKLDKILKKK